jgi:hypothetical protein
MAQLRQIPTRANVDVLWDRLAALTRASIDNPEKMLDREHVQRTILAHHAFADAFLAQVS